MARGLCPAFDSEAYRAGRLTRVYFGSALTRENSALIGTGDREFIRSRSCALALLSTPENTIFAGRGWLPLFQRRPSARNQTLCQNRQRDAF